MSQNNTIKKYTCDFCTYSANRKCELSRHQNSKHKQDTIDPTQNDEIFHETYHQNVDKVNNIVNTTTNNLIINIYGSTLIVYCEDHQLELFYRILQLPLFQRIEDKLILIYNKEESEKYYLTLDKMKVLLVKKPTDNLNEVSEK